MNVKVESEYLKVEHVGDYDGITCCVVNCSDFDHFQRLPQAVSYNGILCGKSGWNSDKNHAYYQSNASLVRKVG
jgi:hypothetical protein